MGVSRNAGPEQLAPVVDGGGWIEDPESDGLLLRPDWRLSWKDNSGWHNKAVVHDLLVQMLVSWPTLISKLVSTVPPWGDVQRRGC